MSERKIRAWLDEGVVDTDTAARIRAWEARHRRPIGLWAIVGLGVLAIGLGILSVVAANWDAIPGTVRLALHFALMLAMTVWLWRALPHASETQAWRSDALLFVTAVLGATFLGHLGQVYQTSSPLWQPLLLWLLLYSPLLLLHGRGWPVVGLWMAGLLGTAFAHATEARPDEQWRSLYWGLIASPPMLVAAAATSVRPRSTRPDFWRLLEQMAVAVILAGITIVIVVRSWDRHSDMLTGSILIQGAALLAAAAAAWAAAVGAAGRTAGDQDRPAQAIAAILAGCAAIHLIQAAIPAKLGPWGGAAFFLLLWGTVAGAAVHAGWRRMFQSAVALIAGRIIILSFELNDDLLGGGVNLILSGLFAIGVAWATVRISKRYAPSPEEPA